MTEFEANQIEFRTQEFCIEQANIRQAAPAPPHPMFVEGYEAGFADALNDVAPDLMAAARAVLSVRDKAAFDALRSALAECKRRAA